MGSKQRRLRVLIVEDCLLTTEQLGETIESAVRAVSISTTTTVTEAIAHLRSHEVDLVFLDLNLKSGSGFQVLKAAKALKPEPIVVVLTNFALPQYRELALSMRADYFIDKAVGMETLPAIVCSIAEQLGIDPRPAALRKAAEREKRADIHPRDTTNRLH
jgi:DNA-binding NarL/FixJ family response regulator